MVSLIERDHAHVSFCSNHILGTALPPSSVGGLRRRGPVTCGFAGSRPAPTRRPRAVSSGCGGARRRARAQACRTARSTGLQFVPVLTSLLPARTLPSAPAELRLRHPTRDIHSRSSTALTGCSGPDRSPSERSPGVPSSPSAPRHEVPGFGAVCSFVRLASWTVPPVLPRVSARQPEPTAGWRDCPRLRSLLAANQWIAETSAVVEPILTGPSPHSLPIESLLLPEAKATPRSSRARKRGVPASAGGTGWGQWPQAGIIRAGSMASQRGGQSPGGRRERYSSSSANSSAASYCRRSYGKNFTVRFVYSS
jgi:hypothetical protein